MGCSTEIFRKINTWACDGNSEMHVVGSTTNTCSHIKTVIETPVSSWQGTLLYISSDNVDICAVFTVTQF